MIKLCYFSGTGNTLWSARKIAEMAGDEYELISIGSEAQKDEIILEADAVIILFPAYAYGPPPIVSNFVKKAVFKTPYIAVFVTFGSSPGGALAVISRILKQKKTGAAYFGRIPSVENYIAIFGPRKIKTIERRLLLQGNATSEAARIVVTRQTNRINTFRPFSALVSMLFSMGKRIFYKRYRISTDCDGCGICEKVCPVSAIVMRNKKPVFSRKCEHCQGCLNWCPLRAIQFGGIKSGTPRYHHPEISIADISQKEIYVSINLTPTPLVP